MKTWLNLETNCIKTNANLKTKDEVLKEISSLALNCDSMKNHSQEDIYKKLVAREKIISTGLENGIAIPHCSFSDIDEFLVGVITTKDPINFKALDSKLSNVFVFIIGPEQLRNKHIKLLSVIAKATRQESFRNLLKKADSPSMVKDIFQSNVDFEANQDTNNNEKSQITIYIQKEEYFDDILQLLSSNMEGSISVLESEAASRYLNKMPLFAAFWNSTDDRFNRIISCIVDKGAINSIIRKIKDIYPEMESEAGVLLSVQDLTFTLGSIDF
jgi:mannitol/fructose-specific phosphotransferase system IIA component (Ntr-type)